MKVLLLPFRTVVLFCKLSGVKGGLLFGLGIATGLLLAPQTGAELRALIATRLAEASGDGSSPHEPIA